ncbi:MAG: hypothetical protein H0X33_03210 [Taibaiella sp.]|nr:hypothetical protein [Taibaiella sp.]
MNHKVISFNVSGRQGIYECKVRQVKEDKETYYHVDVLSPHARDKGSHVEQPIHEIELRFDCDTDTFKIKKYVKEIPIELMEIEHVLSEVICNMYHK